MLNLFFITIWGIRKRCGKSPKKGYLVIPIVFLVISLCIEIIPVGWVLLLREANSSNSKNLVKVESGKVVHWGSLNNGEPNGTFRYGNSIYKEASNGKTNFESIYKNVTLNPGTYEKLNQIFKGQKLETVEVPKNDHMDQNNKQRYAGNGYNARGLYVYSKDGVSYKFIELVLISGQIYTAVSGYRMENGYEKFMGCRLPNELNEYLISTVFRD